jgi:phosphoribosylformylglycinamidine synthase
VERIHINCFRDNPTQLQRYQILVIPGGFTFGDDVAAGKILANQLATCLGDALRRFRDADRLILGICNGCQVLVKAGMIIPPDEDGPLLTITNNASGKFEDRWVQLRAAAHHCPFLKGYSDLHLPVAHAEGRVLFRESWIQRGLEHTGQVALRYVDVTGDTAPYPANPNGSQGDVAGLCDLTGRVLGLMPHPERHVLPTQHPTWTRDGLAAEPDGARLFRNAIEHFL